MPPWLALACSAPLPPPSPPEPASAPPLDEVDRLCPGAPVRVGRGDAAGLTARLGAFEPSRNGFVLRLAEPLDPAGFFDQFGPLLDLGPGDALHATPGGYALCHDGVRVAGAGVVLFGGGDAPVTGASAILYRLDPGGGRPTLSPAEALAIARTELPLARCDGWTLVFTRAWQDPELAYGCRTADRAWAQFSAHTGRVLEASRGPVQ